MRRRGWLVWFLTIAGMLRRRTHRREQRRIVPEGEREPRAELVVIALLMLSALAAAAFVVFYGLSWSTQALGGALAGSLAFLAAALILAGNELVVEEELAGDYPEPHPEDQEELAQVIEESGSRITRKKLLGTAAGCAVGTLGVAFAAPAVSLGPLFDTSSLYRTPWSRGRRLVDDEGVPYKASDITTETFYTAYPEGASKEDLGAPLIVVRIDPVELQLPPGREGWAPAGILAFSKICTHAGCAIALYRKPTFPETQPKRALVCPCHYSTFDPARGAEVTFGPAGRPLPQLPLLIDVAGGLRAAGNYSGPVGPSFWGVRANPATNA
jgi:ubiquinol-cytochrome c reductase iron-sulfur subunit